METIKTFEETYPKYPFAELVRLSIALGRVIGDRRRRKGAATVILSIFRRAAVSPRL